QHVLIFLIAEILGHRESGKRDAETSSGWLVHLAIHQTNARTGFQNRQPVWAELHVAFFIFLTNDHVGFSHFIIEIVALARTLADTCKHRDAAMQLSN